jgi:hypothetical protein
MSQSYKSMKRNGTLPPQVFHAPRKGPHQTLKTIPYQSQSALPALVGQVAYDILFPTPDPFVNDPVTWMHDQLGHHLWQKQVEILEALRDNRMVAVQSCHGPGKSFTGSGAVSWWIDVHDLGSAFAVTTAPSWPQVEAILWREIRRRYREGDLRGRITLDCQWHMGDAGTRRADKSEEIVAMGRKPADYDESTFQGIHARYFLALLDEACGVPETLWKSVLSLATNENARILALGNPDDPNSHFAKVCKPGSGWKVIKISVWDTPNFTGDTNCAVCGQPLGDNILESLVSKLWVDDRRRDWGEGSPTWVSKVDGEFPDVSDDYLISPTLILKCQERDLPGLGLGRYGADIARFGTDKSCLYRNRDGVIRLVEKWTKANTMVSAGKIARRLGTHGTDYVPTTIDVIGVGAGVYDRLRELRLNVSPYQGSQRAINANKFKNRRSESWWTFKELMEAGLIDLDPADDILAAQLGSIKWDTDSAGRIYVETKDDMKSRGLPSPDHADAAIMSTVADVTPLETYRERRQQPSTLTSDLMRKVM